MQNYDPGDLLCHIVDAGVKRAIVADVVDNDTVPVQGRIVRLKRVEMPDFNAGEQFRQRSLSFRPNGHSTELRQFPQHPSGEMADVGSVWQERREPVDAHWFTSPSRTGA